jgi:uncharacterized membrane protein YsdA (DUF1294 family)/cold shock CspA family protein
VRYKGRVTRWEDDKGFGFVAPSLGGERVFLHISAFRKRRRRPVENDLVTYELAFDDRRRPRASNVLFSADSGDDSARPGRSFMSLAVAGAFVALVAVGAFAGRLPLQIPLVYLGGSALAFVMYAIDKSAARHDHRRRTPESTLHLIALVGGWPGALLAQRVFRHKSSKAAFQRVFWATVVLNCLALGWWLWTGGV